MINLNISAEWMKPNGEKIILDERFFQVLKAIAAEGSFSSACKSVGMSYRTLWTWVQKTNAQFEDELISTHGRAGACLTRMGHKVLWMYEQANVRIAPEIGVVVEQLNAEWLQAKENKPWVSMATGDDPVLQQLLHDPALHQRMQLSLRWAGSISALSALHRGEVKIAGCQLPDTRGDGIYTEVHRILRRWLRGENLSVIHLFERETGWISRNMIRPPTLTEVHNKRAQLVNHSPSSSAHHQLNALIEQAGLNAESLPGYHHEENSHVSLACTIAAGHGDLGIGIQAAADQYGLSFRPLVKEHYFLVVHMEDLNFPAIVEFRSWLQSDSVKRAIQSTPGYAAPHIGELQVLEEFLNQMS